MHHATVLIHSILKTKKYSITLKNSEASSGKLKSLLSHTVCNFTRCVFDPIIDSIPVQSKFEKLTTAFFMLRFSNRSFIIQALRIMTGQAKLVFAEFFLLENQIWCICNMFLCKISCSCKIVFDCRSFTFVISSFWLVSLIFSKCTEE